MSSFDKNHELQSPKSDNTIKTFVDWNNERKLSLALACHRHKGHLHSKELAMATKWQNIAHDLWRLPLFVEQKVLKPGALRNIFSRFLLNLEEMDDSTPTTGIYYNN